MILKLYKSNISLGVILIPLFAIVISLPILFDVFVEREYYYDWQNIFFNWTNKNNWINFGLNCLLLIANSALINQVFSRSNFFSKSTYIPALLYIVLISFIGSGIGFGPLIIVHGFLLLLVDQLMKIEQNNSAVHISFKSALLVGAISCFSFYYIIVAFVVMVAIYTLKSFNWREWTLVPLGVFIPVIYLLALQYVFDVNFDLGQIKGVYNSANQLDLIHYVQMGCFSLIVLTCIKSIMVFYGHNTTITRKRLFVLLTLFIVLIFAFIIAYSLFGELDYLFIVPLTLLLSISSIHSKSDSLISLLLTIALVVNIVSLFIA